MEPLDYTSAVFYQQVLTPRLSGVTFESIRDAEQYPDSGPPGGGLTGKGLCRTFIASEMVAWLNAGIEREFFRFDIREGRGVPQGRRYVETLVEQLAKVGSGVGIHSTSTEESPEPFQQALIEGLENLDARQVGFMEVVYFGSDAEWTRRLDQIVGLADALEDNPSVSLGDLAVDDLVWAFGDGLPIGIPHSPSSWRNELPEWSGGRGDALEIPKLKRRVSDLAPLRSRVLGTLSDMTVDEMSSLTSAMRRLIAPPARRGSFGHVRQGLSASEDLVADDRSE